MRRHKIETPVTLEGLTQFDGLDPAAAAVKAWTEPGPNPGWHRVMKDRVSQEMPLLARALDRLAEEAGGHE